MDTEPYDYSRRFSGEFWTLLTMACLPIIDGFLLAYINTDLWINPWGAISFGLTALSGAGCVVSAMRLQGSLSQRLQQVMIVYCIVAIFAGAISITQPIVKSVLPKNLHLFTGIFLLGMGMSMSNIPTLRMMANWSGFHSAIRIILAATIVQMFLIDITWELYVNKKLLISLAIATVSGGLLTTVGAVLGVIITASVDQRPLNIGAGISLIGMGLSVLGITIPPTLIIIPLALGCLILLSRAVQGNTKHASSKPIKDTASLLELSSSDSTGNHKKSA